MRYRDCPTVEVSRRIAATTDEIWAVLTDITLSTRYSAELQEVEWTSGDTVAVGSRFRGRSSHQALGDWETESEVVEVEPGRRWVWNVLSADGGASATWGFEVDPGRDAATVRQWGRLGPADSGLSYAIRQMPEKEPRIIANRLAEWQRNMESNLEGIETLLARSV